MTSYVESYGRQGFLVVPGVVDQDDVAALTELLGPNVKCMQSMFFVKNAVKPGQA